MPGRKGEESAGAQAHTVLEALSAELIDLSARLSVLAAQEKRRRRAAALERITAGQLRALLIARYARCEALGLDLAHPGWSLLLELFLATLERWPAQLARLAADAHVASTTALRWIERLVAAGFADRRAHPDSEGVTLTLTDVGAEAMEDYYVSVQLGWAEAGGPEWSG